MNYGVRPAAGSGTAYDSIVSTCPAQISRRLSLLLTTVDLAMDADQIAGAVLRSRDGDVA